MNQVYDTLNNLHSPDFYLSMRLDGAPATQPAGAKLRAELSRWLATLDRQEIAQIYSDGRFEEIPQYKWKHDGWRIVFEPMPKGDIAKGDTSVRPIGMTMPLQARQLNLDEALRDAVRRKDKYGNPALPLVVAVQVIDEARIDAIDVMNGLFGSEAITVDAQGRHYPGRVPNGVWISPSGPRHGSISMVMAWSKLDPWKFSSVEPIVVHNPHASMPLPPEILPVGYYVVDQQRNVIVPKPGASMEQVLGLSKDWVPED